MVPKDATQRNSSQTIPPTVPNRWFLINNMPNSIVILPGLLLLTHCSTSINTLAFIHVCTLYSLLASTTYQHYTHTKATQHNQYNGFLNQQEHRSKLIQ
jgi:hypothetical protein